MLRKDDPVYYKVKLERLFAQALENGLEVELGLQEVFFSYNNYECASAKLKIAKIKKGETNGAIYS